MVLLYFIESLNIVTGSQHAENVVLYIENCELIVDDSELATLLILLKQIIRERNHRLYITHIRSLISLPGPLAKYNDEIDQLLIDNTQKASELHKKHYVDHKGLKKDFSNIWH